MGSGVRVAAAAAAFKYVDYYFCSQFTAKLSRKSRFFHPSTPTTTAYPTTKWYHRVGPWSYRITVLTKEIPETFNWAVLAWLLFLWFQLNFGNSWKSCGWALLMYAQGTYGVFLHRLWDFLRAWKPQGCQTAMWHMKVLTASIQQIRQMSHFLLLIKPQKSLSVTSIHSIIS